MNELEYAKTIYEGLSNFKNSMEQPKDYIASVGYRNINEIKELKLDIEKILKYSRELGLTADYVTNLKGHTKTKYIREHKNELIAFILN